MADIAGKRIGLLTAHASRQGGGVAEAVLQQAKLVRELGANPVVFTLDDADLPQDRARFGDVPVNSFPPVGPRQIGFASRLPTALRKAGLDLLHLHGIWQYPSRAAWQWGRQTRQPVIVSAHGMLDPWILARSRVRKAVARLGYERASWRDAAILHALTSAEAADISAATGREAACIIPNAAPDVVGDAGTMPPPNLLYLGRIHPKKNLHTLLDAWPDARKPEGARLQIAGWGDTAEVGAVSQRCEAMPDVDFLGPVYGDGKERALRGARFVILPSLGEGLPMVILEGWSHARPTIMTDACHLPQGFKHGAAFQCGVDATAISLAIETALAMGEEAWRRMANNALALAAGPFGSHAVAQEWEKAYASVMDEEV